MIRLKPDNTSCIFCEIVSKRADASVVYEDEKVIAFMDIHPLGEGHVLVIPKHHAEYVQELSAVQQKHLFSISNQIIKAQRAVGFGEKGTNILINDGKAANQRVPHVHVHLVPRTKGDLFSSAFRVLLHITGLMGMVTKRATLEEQAAAIRASLDQL
ncbi:MAG: HIT family protein [Hahellaceae bacterium]|nr:HIT family protein [Hahellaceae bacterium]MCP5169079.1 HIT family protein [Hahellaceae bacterium]